MMRAYWLFLAAGVVLVTSCKRATPRQDEGRPILVFNEDNTHYIRRIPKEEFTVYFDSVCRGAVTHFFMCPNAMRSNVDTKSIEPIWEALNEKGVDPGWGSNAKWLHDNGIDPYAIWTECARRKGVSPWLTIRMNDVHSASDPTFCDHSTFWKNHPEYKVCPHYDGKDWFRHALDYSHEEVRSRMLGYIEELLIRYDVDGIECDWLRFPKHLPFRHERENAAVLTSFMRDVRKRVDAASAKKGRGVLLGARVTSSYAGALELGTDAVAWAREKLVDWLVVGNFFETVDFDIDYAEWSRLVHEMNPNVTILPALDSGVVKEHKGARRLLTLDEFRGWCDTQYAQGAPGIYVFNPFHFSPTSQVWNAILNGELAPDAVKCATRRVYPVSYRECASAAIAGYQTNVSVGGGREVRIRVGDTEGTSGVSVRMAFDRLVSDEDLNALVLNGCPVETCSPVSVRSWMPEKNCAATSLAASFPSQAARSGINVLSLPPMGKTKLVACEMELLR